MSPEGNGQITQLLLRWNEGDRGAYERLVPLVYEELRRIAHRIDSTLGHQTLQPTAVVHELYLKLAETDSRCYQSREHFFSLAARAMRQILIDRGRQAQAAKRGGAVALLPLDEARASGLGQQQNILDLHEALTALEAFDERRGRIVELRYFGGLKVEEIAAAEKLSPETIRRDLRLAEAWLLAYLNRGGSAAQ